MDPIIAFLNKIIAAQLPAITQAAQNGIRSAGLDPMGSVVSGHETLGSIDLGIGSASVGADYSVSSLAGLSSIVIDTLAITSGGTDPNDPSAVSGTVVLDAHLGQTLTARVGGGLDASLLFIHKSVGVSGQATVSGVTATGTGSFTAKISGSQLCLTRVSLSSLSLNYGGASIDIDGLGFFNSFLSPLEDLVLDALKGTIRGGIADAVRPVLNDQVNSLLPLCADMPG